MADKDLDISAEEAAFIIETMVVTKDEGLLSDGAARVALKLLDHFGDGIVPSVHRGWFPEDIRRHGGRSGSV
jgi:archaeosine-15-forming tRNA-guanine transglycosylase